MLKDMKNQWDSSFFEYYMTYIHTEINNIAQRRLEKLQCYNPFSGIK